jgi:hypothetical protein
MWEIIAEDLANINTIDFAVFKGRGDEYFDSTGTVQTYVFSKTIQRYHCLMADVDD